MRAFSNTFFDVDDRIKIPGFGDLGTPLRSVNVSEMPKRVSKLAIVTLRAIDGDSLFVMLPRGIQVMQVYLNLTQSCECSRQLHLVVSRATQIDSLDQIIFGVLNLALSSCLKGMGQQFIGNL